MLACRTGAMFKSSFNWVLYATKESLITATLKTNDVPYAGELKLNKKIKNKI